MSSMNVAMFSYDPPLETNDNRIEGTPIPWPKYNSSAEMAIKPRGPFGKKGSDLEQSNNLRMPAKDATGKNGRDLVQANGYRAPVIERNASGKISSSDNERENKFRGPVMEQNNGSELDKSNRFGRSPIIVQNLLPLKNGNKLEQSGKLRGPGVQQQNSSLKNGSDWEQPEKPRGPAIVKISSLKTGSEFEQPNKLRGPMNDRNPSGTNTELPIKIPVQVFRSGYADDSPPMYPIPAAESKEEVREGERESVISYPSKSQLYVPDFDGNATLPKYYTLVPLEEGNSDPRGNTQPIKGVMSSPYITTTTTTTETTEYSIDYPDQTDHQEFVQGYGYYSSADRNVPREIRTVAPLREAPDSFENSAALARAAPYDAVPAKNKNGSEHAEPVAGYRSYQNSDPNALREIRNVAPLRGAGQADALGNNPAIARMAFAPLPTATPAQRNLVPVYRAPNGALYYGPPVQPQAVRPTVNLQQPANMVAAPRPGSMNIIQTPPQQMVFRAPQQQVFLGQGPQVFAGAQAGYRQQGGVMVHRKRVTYY